MLLVVAMFAMATPAEARTDLTATASNTYALYVMTYQQPWPQYVPWAPYVTTAGVYKGDLLKWGYSGSLDTNPNYRRSLSINSYWGTITGVNMADPNGNLYGECVSFVKSVAHNNVVTANGGWMWGRNVIKSVQTQPIARGTAIATFMSNGNYDSDGTVTGNNHVAIFDRYNYVNGVLKGIMVWDQNYVYGCVYPCGKGLIGYHEIPIANTGKMTDAAAYYVVTV